MGTPYVFRDFARRIRKMIAAARTDAVRDQLATWVEEFEQQAETLERELATSRNPAD